MAARLVPACAVLIVFIHGFKGSADSTFEDFPNRLAHILGETHKGLTVESVVYPTYDTKGQLTTAVDNFLEWLTEQTLERESKPLIDEHTGQPLPASETGKGGGAGSVKIIIAGHSMGGLVGVDAALAIARSTATAPDSPEPLWPRICGVLAYDTPYFGVHPNTFKHSIDKVSGYVQTASKVGALFAPMGGAFAAGWGGGGAAAAANSTPASPSNESGWGNWANWGSPSPPANRGPSSSLGSGRATGGEASSSSSRSLQPNSTDTTENKQQQPAASTGARSGWGSAFYAAGGAALLAGGAAAIMKHQQIREGVGSSYTWVQDHIAFVGNLWDPVAQRERLDSLVALPTILFHCFYTELPVSKSQGHPRPRTFIILPPKQASSARSFTPFINSKATDEVDAHVSMFSSSKNPLYFQLGQRSASIISAVLADEALFGQSSRTQAATEEEPEDVEGLRQGDREATVEPMD